MVAILINLLLSILLILLSLIVFVLKLAILALPAFLLVGVFFYDDKKEKETLTEDEESTDENGGLGKSGIGEEAESSYEWLAKIHDQSNHPRHSQKPDTADVVHTPPINSSSDEQEIRKSHN